MALCVKCGQEVGTENFCGRCGQPNARASSADATQTPPPPPMDPPVRTTPPSPLAPPPRTGKAASTAAGFLGGCGLAFLVVAIIVAIAIISFFSQLNKAMNQESAPPRVVVTHSTT